MDGHAIGCNVRTLPIENRNCPYCGNQFKPSRSHLQQVVCSEDACQRRRRADYHKKKLKKDPLYRAVCEDSQEIWRQQNPEYMKQYRAKQRVAKSGRAAMRPVVELKRLLSLVKNNLVKNASAFRVTRCGPAVWLVSPKRTTADKNTFANTHVVVIQGVTLDEPRKN